jgi:hypothetical protein
MKVKTFEIRDEGTFIPVLCVDMNPDSGAGGGARSRLRTTSLLKIGKHYGTATLSTSASFWARPRRRKYRSATR